MGEAHPHTSPRPVTDAGAHSPPAGSRASHRPCGRLSPVVPSLLPTPVGLLLVRAPAFRGSPGFPWRARLPRTPAVRRPRGRVLPVGLSLLPTPVGLLLVGVPTSAGHPASLGRLPSADVCSRPPSAGRAPPVGRAPPADACRPRLPPVGLSFPLTPVGLSLVWVAAFCGSFDFPRSRAFCGRLPLAALRAPAGRRPVAPRTPVSVGPSLVTAPPAARLPRGVCAPGDACPPPACGACLPSARCVPRSPAAIARQPRAFRRTPGPPGVRRVPSGGPFIPLVPLSAAVPRRSARGQPVGFRGVPRTVRPLPGPGAVPGGPPYPRRP